MRNTHDFKLVGLTLRLLLFGWLSFGIVALRAAPAAFSITFPGNTSAPGPQYAVNAIDFQWDASAGASSYELYIRDLISQDLLTYAVNGTTKRLLLYPGRPYKWNVGAYSGQNQTGSFKLSSNSRWLTVGISDLYVSGNVLISPDPAAPGNQISIKYTVSNGGTCNSVSSLNRIQIKRGFDTATLIGDDFELPAIQAGGSVQLTANLRIPNSAASGSYSVHVLLDTPGNLNVESNYANDTHSEWNVLTVSAGSPNLTSFQAPGWDDRIIVSKSKGTTRNEFPLLASDTLYVDWGIVNNGDASTTTWFVTQMFIDNIFFDGWRIESPMTSGAIGAQFVNDINIGSLSVGQHTIRIKIDSSNLIAESNESSSDNEYTATLVVGATFKVTSAADTGGRITPIGEQTAREYSTLRFVATPNEGFSVDQWFVNGVAVKEGGQTYTLTVTENAEVKATFRVSMYNLAIGGSGDDMEILIDGILTPFQSLLRVRHGADLRISIIPSLWNQLLEKWAVLINNTENTYFGSFLIFKMLSDISLTTSMLTVNPSPKVSTSGSEITVTDVDLSAYELQTIFQASHDLTCWYDLDVDPTGGRMPFLPDGCSEDGTCAAFFRTLINPRYDLPKTLLFPVAGYSAATAPVSSVLDHCSGDEVRTVESTTPPLNSWYTGGIVIAPYVKNDGMLVLYTGEKLDKDNSRLIIEGTLTSFIPRLALERKLEFKLASLPNLPPEIGYSGHPGYDFAVGADVPVVAAESGWIVPTFSGFEENRLFIEHDDGKMASHYLHMKKWAPKIFDGNDTDLSGNLFYRAKAVHVEKGELLGQVGGAGQVLAVSPNSIEDVGSLVTKILAKADAISSFLNASLNTDGRNAVVAFSKNEVSAAIVKRELVRSFNRIIRGDSIYSVDRFLGKVLRPDIYDLLKKEKLTGYQTFMLNRMLLEDSYPAELSKNGSIMLHQMFPQRFGPHLHYEIYRIAGVKTKEGTKRKQYLLMDPYGTWTAKKTNVHPPLWLDTHNVTPQMDDANVVYQPQ